MSESVNSSATEPADEEPEPVRTRYRVTWSQKGDDRQRKGFALVDDSEMTRPGDPEQRDHLIRLQKSKLLPYGQAEPENITLLEVEVVCNCGPVPSSKTCAYREHKGQRFYMTTSEAYAGCEVIHDRHTGTILGIVSITESVMFLTQVREKYGHQ